MRSVATHSPGAAGSTGGADGASSSFSAVVPPRARLNGGARVGRVRIGAVFDEQAHRRHVGRVGGAPERGRALGVHEAAVPVAAAAVDHVPGMPGQPRVGVGAGLEQRRHHVQIGRLLQTVLLRLRIAGPRLPLGVHRRPQGSDPVEAGREVGVGAAVDEHQGEIEVRVDGGHQKGARGVAGSDLVDVGAAVEQGHRRPDVSLPHGVEEGRQPALGLDGRAAARPGFSSAGGTSPDR